MIAPVAGGAATADGGGGMIIISFVSIRVFSCLFTTCQH